MASNELKVGVLVLLGAAVLTSGILYLQEYKRHSATTTWKVAFHEVGGLSSGDPVLVQGVKQGNVEDISLAAGKVVATIRLNRSIALTGSSRVSIASQGLVGERLVAIDLGPPGAPWPHDSLLVGEFSSGAPEVLSRIGPMLDNIDSVLVSLRRVGDDLHSSGSLTRSMKSVDQASADIASLLKDTRGPLRQAVTDFSATAASLREFTDSRKARLETTVDRFSEASQHFKKITEQFEDASTRMNLVARRMESGEGTLGKLSKDSTIYVQLHKTARDLDDLVKDMKANPKKYLKISIF